MESISNNVYLSCSESKTGRKLLMATYSQRTTFTKDLVLEHAARLLIDGGPPTFRMRDLADSLGVTIPYIYKHFKSREEIISEAYVFLIAEQMEREIEQFRPPAKPLKTPKEFFDLIRTVTADPKGQFEQTRRLRLQGLAATLYDQESAEKISILTQRHHQALVDLINSAIESGAISGLLDPEVLAFIIISVRIGFVLSDVKAGSRVTDEQVWELYEAAFLLLQDN